MIAAVFAGAVLQSAAGFGFALVTAPALFAALDPGAALTLSIVLSIALSTLVLAGERRTLAVRRAEVLALLGWAVPGLVAGVVLLEAVDKPPLQVAVGVAVVAATLVDLRSWSGSGAAPGRWPLPPVGLVSGALTTTTGVNGPPLLMYFQRAGADQHAVRDSLAAYFLVVSPLSAVALAAAGELGLGDVGVPLLALLLALLVVGRAVGRWIFLRLDPVQFRTAGAALALAAGIASIAAGATA